MKKSARRNRHRNKGPTSKANSSATHRPLPIDINRRRTLRHMRNAVIATVLLGGAGWAAASSYRGHLELHDLSAVGAGIPTVVQVHDPQCPICRALQKETLLAAESFREDELQVRVANIRTDEGRMLADRYGVPHITLLLFDGEGRMRQVLRGSNDSEILRIIFREHISRSARAPAVRSG